MKDVLKFFVSDLASSFAQIGHNVVFDKKVLLAEMYRHKTLIEKPFSNTICTMQAGRKVFDCRTEGGRKKPPKLMELYSYLFGEPFSGAHTSQGDVLATKLCFFEMLKRVHISL
jgi:DNA polymerase III epsilon subunit-like protein